MKLKWQQLFLLIMVVFFIPLTVKAEDTVSGNDNGNTEVSAIVDHACKVAEEKGFTHGTKDDPARWTVAVYLCGSDLESGAGLDTGNLLSMFQSSIPENVNVIAITGGSPVWKLSDDTVPEGFQIPRSSKSSDQHTQIWQIADHKMVELYDYNQYLDLSDKQVLKDFLEFVEGYAPAKQTILNLVDHGDGPNKGAMRALPIGGAQDDETEMSLNDIQEALEYGADQVRGDKYDIVQFHCCLMGTIEVAYAIKDCAYYMVASEETELASDWNYNWLSVYNDIPETSGEDQQSQLVGKRIIDEFPGNDSGSSYKTAWIESREHTLALLDLSGIDEFPALIDEFGNALWNVAQNKEKLDLVREIVGVIPNLGEGETGTLDVASLAKRLKKANLSEELNVAAQKLLDAIGATDQIVDINDGDEHPGVLGRPGENGIVLYRGASSVYSDGSGLAIYFPGHYIVEKESMDAANTVYPELSFAKALKGNYVPFVKMLASAVVNDRIYKGKSTLKKNKYSGSVTLNSTDTNNIYFVLAGLSYSKDGSVWYDLGENIAENKGESYVGPDPFKWITFAGVPFTSEIKPDSPKEQDIPCYLITDGKEAKKDGDVVSEEEITTLVTSNEFLDGNSAFLLRYLIPAGSKTSYRPAEDETLRFQTLKKVEKGAQAGKYIVNGDVITSKALEKDEELEDSEYFRYLPVEFTRISNQDAVHCGVRFHIADMNMSLTDTDVLYTDMYYLNYGKLKVKSPGSYNYTGKAIRPTPVFVYNGKEYPASYFEDNLYVTYKNNKNAGTATINMELTDDEFETYNYKTTFKIRKVANTIRLNKKVIKKAKVYKVKRKQIKKKQKVFKVKRFGTGKIRILNRTKKKALRKYLVLKKGKVILKKGAKKGTYRFKLSVAAGKNWKKTVTKMITIKVK